MCDKVCVYLYLCVCMCVCVYMYVCMCVYACVCVYVCVWGLTASVGEETWESLKEDLSRALTNRKMAS